MGKLLIITSIFTNGGGETNLLNILKHFKDKYNFTIAVKRYNKNTHLYRYIKENTIKIVTCPLPSPLSMSKIKLLWSIFIWPLILGLKRFDKIISLEFSKATLIYRILFLKKNGLFIWTPIGNPDDIKGHLLKYKNYAKLLDFVIVESEVHKSKLEPFISSQKLVVIPSFCFSKFKTNTEPRVYNLNSFIRIGYLGRYDKNKGIIELLNIFKELSLKDDNLTLSFFGNHGDAKEELSKLVNNMNLGNKVMINSGWDDEAEYEKILNDIDFIVLPSRSEGLPSVLLEAMAFGKPFVATNVGAIPVLAVNNPNVVIVENNYASIKNGLLKMIEKLRNNEINREDLINYYYSNFGINIILSKWNTIFNSTK
jgi:glycosyltransferase involved in cell wall biosynthesis